MRITEETEYLDRRQRARIARTLTRLRVIAGLDQDQAGHRLGMTGLQFAELERNRNWKALVVMGWARANDRVLTLGLGDLVVPPDGDQGAVAYEVAMRSAERGQGVDLMHLRLVHRNLLRIRRAAGISDADMADRLGATQAAVGLFDANPDTVTLGALQRHTRALGGRMRPVLTNRRPSRRGRPPSVLSPGLAAANTARAALAAARTVGQARAVLETRGPGLSAQDTLFLAMRANQPAATLAELAAACGVTKDRYVARLGRLLAKGSA